MSLENLTGRSRAEHIAFCKKRALELAEQGDYQQAVCSMMSDLDGHPETKGHAGGMLGFQMLIGGLFHTKGDLIHWIEGFN